MSDKLRAHHIFCTLLYEGKGYSGAFCENMTAVVQRLCGNAEEELLLTAEPDMICANCPNHTAQDTCANDANRVTNKDRRVMERLHLEEGSTYTYGEMCRHAREYVSEEVFMEICGTCNWRKQGLCRYEDLIARLDCGMNKVCFAHSYGSTLLSAEQTLPHRVRSQQ